MADRIELALRPKTDAKPLDLETAKRIGRVARAVRVELDEGGAVFGFARPVGDTATARGNVELAAPVRGAERCSPADVADLEAAVAPGGLEPVRTIPDGCSIARFAVLAVGCSEMIRSSGRRSSNQAPLGSSSRTGHRHT